MNIKNRTVYCNDNLNILKGINNDSVDLIYLDPPFNSGRDYVATRQSMARNAEFKDSWDENDMDIEWWYRIKEKHPKLYLYLKDVDDYSKKSNQVYLTMMAVRMLEMHRILKSTGTLYYHCDHSMSHYVKIMLDIIFGINNFRNNIVWCYSGGGISKNNYPRKHDDIFRYTKTDKFTFNVERKAYKENSVSVGKHSTLSGGGSLDLEKGTPITDWWTDIKTVTGWSKEKVGYPTQKPLALMERIIKASSNEGDLVLDPFAGCATTCAAAEKLNRQWVGIDIWEEAHRIIEERIKKDTVSLFNSDFKINKLSKAPKRTDLDPEYKEKKKRKYISDEIKETVYARDNGACVSCGAKEELQYDHIIPFSKGGNDTEENLQILCRSCNLQKSNKYHG